MTRRITIGAAFGTVLSLLVALPALAGGWAEVSLDSTGPIAGEDGTSVIGFTLMQHGVTPVDWGNVTVVGTDPSGTTVQAVATPDGDGHWSATLSLGSTSWQVEVRHADLEIVPISDMRIGVLAAPAAPAATSTASGSTVAWLAVALIGFAILLPLGGGAILLLLRRGPAVTEPRRA